MVFELYVLYFLSEIAFKYPIL